MATYQTVDESSLNIGLFKIAAAIRKILVKHCGMDAQSLCDFALEVLKNENQLQM